MSIKAIILEDDFIIRLYIQKQLEGLGVDVVAVLDRGDELATEVEKHAPDFVIVDVELFGEVNGVDAVTGLDPMNRPAIVYVSGKSKNILRETVHHTQPLAVLSKPVNRSDLERILKMV